MQSYLIFPLFQVFNGEYFHFSKFLLLIPPLSQPLKRCEAASCLKLKR